MKKFTIFLLGWTFSAFLTTPSLAANVYEALRAQPQFSMLVRMIDANDIEFRYIKGEITVFAPTDDALARQPGGVEDMMSGENPSVRENTRALLLYQIVQGRHKPEILKGEITELSTLQRSKVSIDGTGDLIRYGGEYGANVIGQAIEASNGVIIPIDALPIPVFSEITPPPDS